MCRNIFKASTLLVLISYATVNAHDSGSQQLDKCPSVKELNATFNPTHAKYLTPDMFKPGGKIKIIFMESGQTTFSSWYIIENNGQLSDESVGSEFELADQQNLNGDAFKCVYNLVHPERKERVLVISKNSGEQGVGHGVPQAHQQQTKSLWKKGKEKVKGMIG